MNLKFFRPLLGKGKPNLLFPDNLTTIKKYVKLSVPCGFFLYHINTNNHINIACKLPRLTSPLCQSSRGR